MEVIIKGRKILRLPLLVGCTQMCLLSNQSAGFFKNQLISLFFLHGDDYKGKLASKTTTIASTWAGVPIVQSNSLKVIN